MLPWSAFWMTIFLLFDKCLRALNSEGVRSSGGSRSLEKFWCEVSVVASSLSLIKDRSSLQISSRFMLWKNNSKGNKNSEYWINPGLLDSHLPKKIIFICFKESCLKMMKNNFYFILKALFVLKIFKFLSWHFGHVEETAW